MTSRLLTLALAMSIAPQAMAANNGANIPLQTLDLQRYAGLWHEIAHLPMFFQRKCASDITATYTPRDDGTLTVRNACTTSTGKQLVSEGVARPAGNRAGALEVRFAPDWLSWLPMVWADYWVIDVDPGYQWAMVGGPSRKSLWILSRTAGMPEPLFNELKSRATAKGYALDALIVAAPLD